jgi:hypothetical protein
VFSNGRDYSSLTLALLAAAAAPAGARAQINVQSGSVVERVAHPGERYSGVITLRNSSAEPVEAKLYQTDYLTYADGRTLYGEPGTTARSNAKWIAYSPSYVMIPPRQTTDVSYTVTVPHPGADSLAGTYWSMVMVEEIPRSSAESRMRAGEQRQVQIGIQTRVRYAVQMVTELVPGGEAKVTFGDVKVVTKDGRRLLLWDVVNTGQRGFHPQLSLELYDETGALAGKLTQGREPLYPGTSLRQGFDLTRFRSGRYRALLLVDAGGDDVYGGQITLTL